MKENDDVIEDVHPTSRLPEGRQLRLGECMAFDGGQDKVEAGALSRRAY